MPEVIQKHHHYAIYGLAGATTLATVTLLTAVPSVKAERQHTASVSVSVAPVCSMSAVVDSAHAATLLNGTYSGTNYPNGIGRTTIQTVCNDASGYAIYAIGFSGNTDGNNKMLSSAGSAYDIASGTATSGDTSNWAMKVAAASGGHAPTIQNGFANYSAVPEDYTMVASYNSMALSSPASSITTTYAAYISPTQAAGTYTGQVKYVLVHPAGADAPEKPSMQTMDSTKLAALMPNSGDTATLPDKRDGNEYQITNINGAYWMTQNLRYMPTSGTVLSPSTTNVATERTLTTVGALTSGNSYTAPRVQYNSNTEYGAYYNYCAASAGTVCSNSTGADATEDICPSRWRLPTRAELQTIANASGANWNPATAGYYGYGSLGFADSHGYWWSATANANYQYFLNYQSDSNDWKSNYGERRSGLSVRCVYGS